MPKFDIKYSEQIPPAQGPAVRANIDTDTGETALWGAVANLGGTAAKIGLEILGRAKTAENARLYSEGKRKIEERLLLAQRESEAEVDQDRAYAKWAAGLTAAESVANEYKLLGYFNEVAPKANDRVVRGRVAIEQNNALVSVKARYQQAVAELRGEDAAAALGDWTMLQPADRAENELRLKSLPADLKKSRDFNILGGIEEMASAAERQRQDGDVFGSVGSTRGILNAIDVMDNASLTPEARAKWTQLREATIRTHNQSVEAAQNEISETIQSSRYQDEVDRMKTADELHEQIISLRGELPSSEYQSMLRQEDSFRQGKSLQSDPDVQGDGWDKVLAISSASTDDERSATARWLKGNKYALGDQYLPLRKSFADRVGSAPRDRTNNDISVAMMLSDVPVEQTGVLRQGLEAILELPENKNLSPEKREELINGEVSSYMARRTKIDEETALAMANAGIVATADSIDADAIYQYYWDNYLPHKSEGDSYRVSLGADENVPGAVARKVKLSELKAMVDLSRGQRDRANARISPSRASKTPRDVPDSDAEPTPQDLLDKAQYEYDYYNRSWERRLWSIEHGSGKTTDYVYLEPDADIGAPKGRYLSSFDAYKHLENARKRVKRLTAEVAANGIPEISGENVYERVLALPPGTKFIGPDGKERTRQ